MVKALSLKQPFAELILQGKKTIELRTWNTAFRGEFLIHASKSPHEKAMAQFGFTSLPTGGIVGRATLLDVKKYASKEEFDADKGKHCASDGWWNEKVHGFIVANASRLPLRPLKGMLNFFEVRDE